MQLDEGGRSVSAQVLMNPVTQFALNTGSRFWLSKPKLSFSGIEGVDALVGGNYIEIEQGEGTPTTHFVAISKPPVADFSLPGVHLKLQILDR